MKEINIDEKKPNHTKAFLGVGIVVFFVIFFALYYQSFFGTLINSQDAQITENSTGDNIKTVLAQPINLEDKNNSSFSPLTTNFLGRWQGSWDFGDGKTVSAALAITQVVPNVGVTAWYGIETNNSLGIIGSAKSSTGGIVMISEKGPIIGLELPVSQFNIGEPTPISFWFANPENRTLTAKFVHPITQQTIKGTFEPIQHIE